MVPGIYRKDRIRQCIWCHVLLFRCIKVSFLCCITREGGGGGGSLVFTEKTGLENVYGVMSYCLDVSK